MGTLHDTVNIKTYEEREYNNILFRFFGGSSINSIFWCTMVMVDKIHITLDWEPPETPCCHWLISSCVLTLSRSSSPPDQHATHSSGDYPGYWYWPALHSDLLSLKSVSCKHHRSLLITTVLFPSCVLCNNINIKHVTISANT